MIPPVYEVYCGGATYEYKTFLWCAHDERLKAYNIYVRECKKLGKFPLGMQAWTLEQRKDDGVFEQSI